MIALPIFSVFSPALLFVILSALVLKFLLKTDIYSLSLRLLLFFLFFDCIINKLSFDGFKTFCFLHTFYNEQIVILPDYGMIYSRT